MKDIRRRLQDRYEGHERRKGSRRVEDRAYVAREEVRTFQAPLLRKVAVGALSVAAFILVVGFVATIVQTRNDEAALRKSVAAVQKSSKALRRANSALVALQQAQTRQHQLIEQGCQRLNVQRATINAANASEFGIDKVFFVAVRSRRQPPYQRKVARRLLVAERSALRAVKWTPLTNCIAAVALHGSAYHAPRPVSFLVRKPPRSALDATNAGRPVPLGSVP